MSTALVIWTHIVMQTPILLYIFAYLTVSVTGDTLKDQNSKTVSTENDAKSLSLQRYYANLAKTYIYGHCSVKANSRRKADDLVKGDIQLRQPLRGGATEILVNLTGFSRRDDRTRHALTIHEYGDLSNGCDSAGGHYNPFGVAHGSPQDSPEIRHFGDLGNIEESASGSVDHFFKDYLISLLGPFSVLGRAVVVHLNEDDLGTQASDSSVLTGNSGPGVACCTIGLSDGTSWNRLLPTSA